MAPRADLRLIRLAAPVGLAAGVLAATAALHFRDPHVQGSWGICPLNAISGLDCPGCGGLRAVHDLTDLDLVAAASSNLLLVLLVPVAAVLWLRWVRLAWAGERRPLQVSTPVVVVLLGLFAVFAVVRNLPAGAWLAA